MEADSIILVLSNISSFVQSLVDAPDTNGTRMHRTVSVTVTSLFLGPRKFDANEGQRVESKHYRGAFGKISAKCSGALRRPAVVAGKRQHINYADDENVGPTNQRKII